MFGNLFACLLREAFSSYKLPGFPVIVDNLDTSLITVGLYLTRVGDLGGTQQQLTFTAGGTG